MKITTMDTKHTSMVHDGDVEVMVYLNADSMPVGRGSVMFKIKKEHIDLAQITYVFSCVAEADKFAETLKSVVGVLQNFSEDIKAEKASFAMREATKMIDDQSKTDFGYIGEDHGV